MHLQVLFALFVVLGCAFISAQNPTCDRINKACRDCRQARASTAELNTFCRQATRQRWVWRNQTQCDLQRLSCLNPCQAMNCTNIARLSNMRRRPS